MPSSPRQQPEENRTMTRLAKTGFLIAALIIVADLGTKWLATVSLNYATPVEVLPFFNLTLLHNPGAAFSFLADAGGWQRWFFVILATAISGVLAVWVTKLRSDEIWLGTALCFVLGGAVGNLYDRIVHGYVVDFLHFHWAGYHFPAFNIADSFITVGAIMLAIDLFRGPRQQEQTE
ncbi:MAG: lipoprotein signal peptidase [Halomonadaceae bacterium]|nr:MAG: lipoprotein signal peptidase [Halomonadaceae bacterium]